MTAAPTLAACLSAADITLNLRVASKDALLAELARRAATRTNLPEADLRHALLKREALGSTGFGAGIAVPHARIAALATPLLCFVRLDKKLAYDAIDGQPVDLVMLLLSPAGDDVTHLSLLAAISRRLRQSAVAEGLRQARSPEAAHEWLTAR